MIREPVSSGGSSGYEIAVTATFIGLRGEACAVAYLDHGIVDELKCHQLDHELQAARGIKPHSDG